jgi:hypothetical protein
MLVTVERRQPDCSPTGRPVFWCGDLARATELGHSAHIHQVDK